MTDSIRSELRYERIIMGIDPGTNVMGYGLLGVNGRKPEVIVMGVIELNKFESHYMRLHRIFERVTGLCEHYLPDELAIEAPFFGKNVQSMLKLGRAQGVAMAAALSRDIPIAEYAPLSIKQAVTGNGQHPRSRWPICCAICSPSRRSECRACSTPQMRWQPPSRISMRRRSPPWRKDPNHGRSFSRRIPRESHVSEISAPSASTLILQIVFIKI